MTDTPQQDPAGEPQQPEPAPDESEDVDQADDELEPEGVVGDLLDEGEGDAAG